MKTTRDELLTQLIEDGSDLEEYRSNESDIYEEDVHSLSKY